jgi:hypothetical protein
MPEPFSLSSLIVKKYSDVAAVELQIKNTTAPRIRMPPIMNLLICMVPPILLE